MRRLVLLLVVVIATAGCNRFSGPVETRQRGRADPRDERGRPIYTIDEQKLRARERLAITEDDFRIGPRGFIDRPSPTGR